MKKVSMTENVAHLLLCHAHYGAIDAVYRILQVALFVSGLTSDILLLGIAKKCWFVFV